jgi:glyoxylase-like metal-dependent hydrolase (beta-lactamase superfamily II)
MASDTLTRTVQMSALLADLRRGLAAMLCCALLGGGAAAQELKPVQASKHVYYVQGAPGMATRENRAFNANAAFVVTAEGVLVFDALGSPLLGAQLKQAIAGITKQPIRRVIVSHFHADHFYGLQSLQGDGVQIWAHAAGRESLGSDLARSRLEQRRNDLSPYVDANTRLVGADRWLEFRDGAPIDFTFGGVKMRLIDVSGAHSPEDIMLFVVDDGVLLAGDLYFSGRIPFVGQADSRAWLAALDRIEPLAPKMVIPGHGTASRNPKPDIELTRAYLLYLREKMGAAVRDLVPFEEAYKATDWLPFYDVPAFEVANRINAYGTYLQMERELLAR